MPTKYVPFIPEPVEGQAVLGISTGFCAARVRTRSLCPSSGDAPVRDGEAGDSGSTDGNMVIRGGEKTKEFWDGTIQSEAPALENPQYLRRRDGLGGVILCMYTL